MRGVFTGLYVFLKGASRDGYQSTQLGDVCLCSASSPILNTEPTRLSQSKTVCVCFRLLECKYVCVGALCTMS